MKKRLLFLTLNTFSATGGIEKVCRVAGKALFEVAAEGGGRGDVAVFSMYDKNGQADQKYFPASVFRGFNGQRLKFIAASLRKGSSADIVVLSHINLLLVGYLIKIISPKTMLILIAHGIEVWEPLSGLKKRMKKAVDLYLPVSSFTAQKLQRVQGIAPHKIQVLNNCLDPFLEKKSDPEKERRLKSRYGFADNDFILLTLTRLKFSEQYKGYDKVVRALASLKETHSHLKYLIVGRYDEEEKGRLDKIIQESGMEDKVVYAGFVPDEDLAAHFNLADVYIMPSMGEGFGVVFIEALFYGKSVIAGNQDGSVDALANGEFGLLINPNHQHEIVKAIEKIVTSKTAYLPEEKKVMQKFGFEQYKRNWQQILYSAGTAISAKNLHISSTLLN